jgi:hypothetical protein
MDQTPFPETRFELTEDRSRAAIFVGAERMELDADSLQNLIGHLGALRVQMKPEVAANPPENGQFLQIDGPILEVTTTPDGQFVGFLFRTPAYGWIGYSFKRADALSVAQYVLSQIETPAPGNA